MSLLVRENNLYAKGFIIEFEDGDQLLQRNQVAYVPSVTKDKTHVVVEGDTLYGLAYKYYGVDFWWHVIADVNQLYNPLELTLGTQLIIPDLDVIKVNR